MNYPFFIYPGYPFKGYFNFKEYLTEVVRLDNYIKSLTSDCQEKCHLHLTIGAAMEEVADLEDYKSIFIKNQHWRQLLPYFIDLSVYNNRTIPVKVLIIAPNEIFTDNQFKEPTFIRYTNEFYDWDKINPKCYKSKNFNIEINIFCTMMPHNELERNRRLLNQIKQIDENQKTDYL